MKTSPFQLLTLAFGLLFPLLASAVDASGLQVIDFQLRWTHQFQFAGYYAAIEQGYYRDAGLEVRLHEGAPGRVPVDEVLAGRAQYAESNSEVLYERLRGKPLVALAAIVQHSPSVLLVRADSGIRTPHDLVGKKVMLMDGKNDSDFYAMLLHEGVKPENVKILPASFDIGDLVSGKVDALNAYLSNEPFVLKRLGLDYAVINPSHYGIDYYSDVLFTTEQELRDHPDRVEAFRVATLRGWRYAMDHPAEMIDLLINNYQVRKSRAHLEFEAQTLRTLILPDLVEIGHMNPGRWQSMADAFKLTGMVDKTASLEGFIYDPTPHLWAKRTQRVVFFLGSIIGAVLIAVLILVVVHRRLRREIALRRDVEEQLSQTNAMLQRTGKIAKVGGWTLDFVNDRNTWADEACRIREIPPGTVLTQEQAMAFYEPEVRTFLVAAKAAAIKDGTPWEHESLMTTATGKRIWVHSRCEALVRDGKTVLLTGILQDINDRKLAEIALQRRTRELEMHNRILWQIHQGMPLNEMLESMIHQIEALHPGMLCSILLCDDHGKQLVHAAAPSLAGFFTHAIDGLTVGFGVGSCGTAAYRGERVIVENLQQHPYWLRFRELAALAGLQSCWSQPIKNHLGDVLGTFAIYHRQPGAPDDEEIRLIESYATLALIVIERHRAEAQIRNLAFYDTLTQLPNRRMLDDRLAQAMEVSKRSGRYGALMFLDLDNFKPLNDSHGHAVGDLLLIQVAQRISGCVRGMDTVARFGGDEFVVMLGELDEDEAESIDQAGLVAEKIRSVLAEPYRLNGNLNVIIEHRCTASIGVAMFVNHDASLDEILKRADQAMYQAKDAGRDSISFYLADAARQALRA